MEDMNFTVATIERLVRENDRLTYEAKEKELVAQLEQEKRRIIAEYEKKIAAITAEYEQRVKGLTEEALDNEHEADGLREINAQLQLRILELQRHK